MIKKIYSFFTEKYVLFIWIILFFFIFSIINLLNLLLLIETIWISLFIYMILKSHIYDSLLILLFSFFSLTLATAETTIGLSILLLKYVISGNFLNLNYLKNNNYYFLNNTKKKIINDKII